MLFSEPKIPQSVDTTVIGVLVYSFQCSSASRKFLNSKMNKANNSSIVCFSALQRAENSSIQRKSRNSTHHERKFQCSSASRKFLNFAKWLAMALTEGMFQCSSASRKFLNVVIPIVIINRSQGFSALQRAENSSIPTLAPASIHISDRDDHASSFLSLPGASP